MVLGDGRDHGRRVIGGGVVFSEKTMHVTKEVLLPDEVIGGGDGILFAAAAPVLAELSGGRKSATLPWSDAGRPSEGLLPGEHHLGCSAADGSWIKRRQQRLRWPSVEPSRR